MASPTQPSPAGAGAAATSLVVGLLASLIGALGTLAAFTLVPSTWSDSAQLAALSVPALVAALLGGVGLFAGSIGVWRGGLARWPGWVAVLGMACGGATLVGAGAWLLFLGGLLTLAAFAWH